MAIPKVKISFDADFDDLKRGVKGATTEVEGFGGKIDNYSKKVGAAFAIAGAAAAAYAGKLLIDGVKSAIEDEAAQSKLATTLTNVAGATGAQIAQTEAYILKMSLATGVADDELRPSFERLTRATSDIKVATDLQTLALDVSAGSGKSLQAVSEAISKAYEGNTTALGKLGIGIDKADLKTMSFETITAKLATTFKDQSSVHADTFAGKMAILKTNIDEAKEGIGEALMPVLTTMMDYIIKTVLPNFQSFINALTGKGSLTEATKNGTDGAFKFGERIKKVITTIIDLKDEIIIVGSVIAGVFAVAKISAGITATIAAVKSLIAIYNTLKASALVAGIAQAFALNPLLGVGAVAVAAGVLAAANALVNKDDKEDAPIYTGNPNLKASSGVFGSPASGGVVSGGVTGGTTSGSTTSKAAAANPLVITKPSIESADYLQRNLGVTNITVNGAIDPESTARQIIDLLNGSAYRGSGGANRLVMV